MDYFGKIKVPLSIYNLRNGLKFFIRRNSSDRNLINEICIKNDYTRHFKIKEGDIVVDIGANIGIFSILASQRAKKVYSFEPVLENFKMLTSNVKLNQKTNCILLNKAVSNTVGSRRLFLADDNFGGNSFSGDHWQVKEHSQSIEVETTNLETFIKKNKIDQIDFLKIDCEGAEYEILMNCSKSVLSKIKKISMEFHNFNGDDRVLKLIDFLKENKFEVRVENLDYPIGMIYAVNKQ